MKPPRKFAGLVAIALLVAGSSAKAGITLPNYRVLDLGPGQAIAFNDAGDTLLSVDGRVQVWRRSDQTRIDLGPGQGVDINNNGQAVIVDGNVSRLINWQSGEAWIEERLDFRATGMNDWGDVVGYGESQGMWYPSDGAYYYRHSDRSSTEVFAGWDATANRAWDINNNGVIAVSVLRSEDEIGFKLTPDESGDFTRTFMGPAIEARLNDLDHAIGEYLWPSEASRGVASYFRTHGVTIADVPFAPPWQVGGGGYPYQEGPFTDFVMHTLHQALSINNADDVLLKLEFLLGDLVYNEESSGYEFINQQWHAGVAFARDGEWAYLRDLLNADLLALVDPEGALRLNNSNMILGNGGTLGGAWILEAPNSPTPSAVPEPSTWLLGMIGVATMGAWRGSRSHPGARRQATTRAHPRPGPRA